MIKHIKPLPISEEMLGAYLEGNLSLEEAREVEGMIGNNDELNALMDEIINHEIDEGVSIETDFPNWIEGFELTERNWEDFGWEECDLLLPNGSLHGQIDSFLEYGSDDMASFNESHGVYGEIEFSDLMNTECNCDGLNENDAQWDN